MKFLIFLFLMISPIIGRSQLDVDHIKLSKKKLSPTKKTLLEPSGFLGNLDGHSYYIMSQGRNTWRGERKSSCKLFKFDDDLNFSAETLKMKVGRKSNFPFSVKRVGKTMYAFAKKDGELYVQEIDKNTLELKGKPKLLLTKKDGYYELVLSEDKTKLLIIHFLSAEDATDLDLITFDEKLIKSEEASYHFESEKKWDIRFSNFIFTNRGDIFFQRTDELSDSKKGMRVFKSIISIKQSVIQIKKGGQPPLIHVFAQKGKHLYSLKYILTDKSVIAGGYAVTTMERKKKKKAKFGVYFGESSLETQKITKKDYNPNDFFKGTMNVTHVVLGKDEEVFIVGEERTSEDRGNKVALMFSIHGIVAIDYVAKAGNFKWQKIINKLQEGKEYSFWDLHFSFFADFIEDKLVLIYNDHKKNISNPDRKKIKKLMCDGISSFTNAKTLIARINRKGNGSISPFYPAKKTYFIPRFIEKVDKKLYFLVGMPSIGFGTLKF